MNRYPRQPGGRRPPQGPRRPLVPASPPGLGPEYLRQQEYFDQKGNLWPELVAGEKLCQWTRALGQRQGQVQLKTTQLRRFYGKAREIERELDLGRTFEELRAEILSLRPLAANTVARGNATDTFKDFIDRNVSLAVRDEKHFRRGFLVHFQSVVAYFTYLSRR